MVNRCVFYNVEFSKTVLCCLSSVFHLYFHSVKVMSYKCINELLIFKIFLVYWHLLWHQLYRTTTKMAVQRQNCKDGCTLVHLTHKVYLPIGHCFFIHNSGCSYFVVCNLLRIIWAVQNILLLLYVVNFLSYYFIILILVQSDVLFTVMARLGFFEMLWHYINIPWVLTL